MDESSIYSIIGEEGFAALVSAFYRQIGTDDILGPMYPSGDLKGAEQRLREFLIFRFGGPPRYIEDRGHPRLRMRHAHFAVDGAARDRWLQLMHNALLEAQLPQPVEQTLRQFFESTAAFLQNRPG